ncbi:MAG: DNA repair protein RecN [Clostridiales bacterium]|nr:DNA repair protein RecN [Clostridiales bacterium]
MLSSLHIENIAVIKSADIDFSDGFTVLTGETGAGKSIIIDSINLILGAKQSRDLIRSGEDSAQVSALFSELPESTASKLCELGISPDEDGLIMLSRTITTSGKSTARVNGRVIPLSLEREAAKQLIAIHGQHDNMILLEPENHIVYLDEYAGLSSELGEYTKNYEKLCELNRRISELSRNEREKAQRIEFLKFQIDEIEAAKLKPNEEEILMKKRAKLQNSEKINQLSRSVYSALYQNEKGTAALDKVRRSMRALDALSVVIPDAEELSARLEALTYELEDIALTAQAFADDSIDDPTAQLDKLETRLDEISKLERKYGDTIEDVLAFLSKTKGELETIELSEERLTDYINERAQLLPILAAQADELSERRSEAAKQLEERIIEELAYLDMKGVTFSAGITRRADSDDAYTRRGLDDVEFLISTNRGEPLKPLAKIASGGELSRIMLAIKSVLANRDSISTLIFDEVDTGVSGKTSQKIGIKLRELAKSESSNMQVLCVTHSAQIAAIADNHCLIAKREVDGRVSTSITPLDSEGRVREVARIMGGINITDRLLETAREMINEKL